MGLASALSTALTGLTAAETTIDVVGNNLANANTVGFKASEATFATQFLQTLSLGSAASGNTGGTNPKQIGMGTIVAAISVDMSQGTIETSASSTDMAIEGEGFFVVQSSAGEKLFTRNGSFTLNSQSQLVTQTGEMVLGYDMKSSYNTLEAITIPLGSETVAVATENVYLEGVLTPAGTVATQGTILESAIYCDAAFSRPESDAAGTTAGISIDPNFTTTKSAIGGTMAAGDIYSYRVVVVDSSTGTESMYETRAATVDAGVTTGSVSVTVAAGLAAGTILRVYRTDNTGTGDYNMLTQLTVADIGTPTSYVDTGAAAGGAVMNDDTISGTYRYYITYVDASGNESRASEVVIATAMSDQGRVVLSHLPEDDTGDWVAFRIYRNTADEAGTFYLVDEVNVDPADLNGVTFTDCAADADIKAGGVKLDPYGSSAVRASSSTLATNLLRKEGDEWVAVYDVGTFNFTGKKGERTLTTKSMEIDATTTLSTIARFMADALGVQTTDDDPTIKEDASGQYPGVYITANGTVRFVGNSGNDNGLGINLSGMQLTNSSGTTNTVQMEFTRTQVANGTSTSVDFIVYDSLGMEVTVRMTAVLESLSSETTTYRWYCDSADNLDASLNNEDIAVGTGLIRFDGDGNYVSNTSDTVTIYRDDIAARTPLVFRLDFSELSGLAANKSSLAVSSQDGCAPGTLTSFEITEDGLIRGVFSNGVTMDLAQLVLASFANPAGLKQMGSNLYGQSANSGLPVYATPGESGLGTITAGALELSNTDIGSNLIDLILASTMYRGNSRVITTVQDMFDELLTLSR